MLSGVIHDVPCTEIVTRGTVDGLGRFYCEACDPELVRGEITYDPTAWPLDYVCELCGKHPESVELPATCTVEYHGCKIFGSEAPELESDSQGATVVETAAEPTAIPTQDTQRATEYVAGQKIENAKWASLRAEFRRKQEGREAFDRLYESKSRGWAIKWNEWIASVDTETRDRLVADKRFMALYNAAMLSNTVPSKRKAIKEVLAYVGQK